MTLCTPDITGQITQLMEQLDVFISLKPKAKQPLKVCSCERGRFYYQFPTAR